MDESIKIVIFILIPIVFTNLIYFLSKSLKKLGCSLSKNQLQEVKWPTSYIFLFVVVLFYALLFLRFH